MRAFLIALFVFLWFLLGYFMWQCHDYKCHADDGGEVKVEEKVSTPIGAVEEKYGPLTFNYSDGKAVTGEGWEEYKASLTENWKDGEFLEITGLYRSDETNSSTFENLGLARANESKSLFSPPVPDDKIMLKSKLVDDNVNQDRRFASADIRRYVVSDAIDESIPDRTIIRFPFNSTDKLNDSSVETYLDKVAERVKKSGERVSLTGHTDNVDSNAFNNALGQRRADIIKRYLISKGVAANKIIAQSKGESSPIASNDSSQGRAQNRRTELQIIK